MLEKSAADWVAQLRAELDKVEKGLEAGDLLSVGNAESSLSNMDEPLRQAQIKVSQLRRHLFNEVRGRK